MLERKGLVSLRQEHLVHGVHTPPCARVDGRPVIPAIEELERWGGHSEALQQAVTRRRSPARAEGKPVASTAFSRTWTGAAVSIISTFVGDTTTATGRQVSVVLVPSQG